jgi:hypothetical protein
VSALEKRIDELRELADKRATAIAERDYLEEFKKSKLAILMAEAEQAGATTNAAQEREARRNKDYLIFLDGYRVAVELAEKLDWELKIALKGADLWQTQQANERAERRAYGA